jgi:hypothetical protein
MALRCTVSASKRPEEVRKPQQGLAARFKLCGRKPLRGLPPSPRWTWRCALREANVRKGLGGHTRSSGTYLGPSGCANAPRNFVLAGRARPEDEKRKLAPRRRDRWQRGAAHEIRSADETRDRGEGTQDTECPHALDMVQGQQQRPK